MSEKFVGPVRSLSIAEQVHQMLLDSIVSGDLVAGQPLHTAEWATLWDISRTPIREAFLRLGYQGLVDAEAARFTRLHNFSKNSAIQVAREWATAHSALADAVPHNIDDISIARLERFHEQASACDVSVQQLQARNFEFFGFLRETAQNFGLQLGLSAIAYRFRLAEPRLPRRPHADATLRSEVISALRQSNPDRFRRAFDRWVNTTPDPHDEAPANAVGNRAPEHAVSRA